MSPLCPVLWWMRRQWAGKYFFSWMDTICQRAEKSIKESFCPVKWQLILDSSVIWTSDFTLSWYSTTDCGLLSTVDWSSWPLHKETNNCRYVPVQVYSMTNACRSYILLHPVCKALKQILSFTYYPKLTLHYSITNS